MAAAQPFPRHEYLERLARVRGRMQDQGIDLLLVTSPENIFYLSGYSAFSFYTPQVLLLGAEGGDPLLILRAMDVPCAHHTSWLPGGQIVGYPDEYVDSDTLHPWGYFSDVIERSGWSRTRIGLEIDGYWLPARAKMILDERFPGSSLVDATLLVNWVRLVKSPAELACMRDAARIADRAMAVAAEVVRPGVRECDAVAEINKALISGTPEAGGYAMAEPVIVAPAERSDSPHLYWTDQPFNGDVAVNIELGGSRWHYHAGLSRTLFLGSTPQRLEELFQADLAAFEAAFSAMRPGVAAEDVARAFRETLETYGHRKSSRVGYAIGIGVAPSWLERTVSLRMGDRSILSAGMTFHIMAGLWEGELTCVLSETVCITEDGAETLSSAPRRILSHA